MARFGVSQVRAEQTRMQGLRRATYDSLDFGFHLSDLY